MTIDQQHLDRTRAEWVRRLSTLTDQIADWAADQGWEVTRGTQRKTERLLGTYDTPTLDLRTPSGELYVRPVAFHVAGADGRVDLEAYPTLNRVKLVGRDGGWEVYTESNVPLRQPWDAAHFVQLANDLTA